MAEMTNYLVSVRCTDGKSKDGRQKADLLVTSSSIQAAEGRAERYAQQTFGGRWRVTFSTNQGPSIHDTPRVRHPGTAH